MAQTFPNAKVPMESVQTVPHNTGVSGLLPVVLRLLGRDWDLAIVGWPRARRDNGKARTRLEASNPTWQVLVCEGRGMGDSGHTQGQSQEQRGQTHVNGSWRLCIAGDPRGTEFPHSTLWASN